jgi:hypothetical protein
MSIQHGSIAGHGIVRSIIIIIISSSSSSNMRAWTHNGHTGERGMGVAPYAEQC